ncbi:uncharacterized protein SPAPADRAFT_61511 [Spathaspora passalidarum NRRL Y-27907]|uniref:DUF605-domain-containing protein n=1 Tax=Spathaspora passalidarum (strain NRRL Y-27907 / 11-Y1) TaxID=619300 RepID=G3AN29_SPAPN|nr:uncharacterized protein SPAPADRAFT_61511 [Spathaspora passalidarum NRRL Y-27907]EGW32443.1 hypothetical protein SPAPADRAFT_61511 [Spathaspora passalidarum NRRL Y-27907]
MINLESIPEELKSDKSITPFIARALELATVNPVVSYYCKFYVLDHILTNKLHTKSKDIESFTIELLDDTEQIKKSTDDENLHKVLQDKNLSITVVLTFAYKLFNSCLESLNGLTRANKAATIQKFRATLTFLQVLSIFNSEEIEWSKLTGGKADSFAEFDGLNKEKIKVIKYHLSRLIKDEVVYTDEPNDEELEQELEDLTKGELDLDEPEEAQEKEQIDKSEEPTPEKDDLVNLDNFDDDKEKDTNEVSLPGVPHIPPQDSDDDQVKLPGAPTYLPDDDITHINKDSSIHVFPPSPPAKHVPTVRKASASSIHTNVSHAPITKETIKQILNRDDTITQVQKHAKFSISALQFEDFDEAEKQLKQGLELLQILKKQEEHS